jgi:diacylglycerol kinase family enzyme
MRQEPASTPDIAVVLNGNARSVTQEVVETMDQIIEAGSLFVSRRVEEVDSIAATLLDRGYDTVLTGGGDGTFTMVVSALWREARRRGCSMPRVGMLRLGTGNSLAWVIGAGQAAGSRSLSIDLQRLRRDAGSREAHLIEVGDMLTPFCGLGIDAVMLADYHATLARLGRAKRLLSGAPAYALAAVTRTLPAYLLRPTPHCRVVNLGADAVRVGAAGKVLGGPIRRGSVIYEGPAKIAALSTIPFYGFGFRMFPYAEERAGRMQLRISNVSSSRFVKRFGEIFRGTYEDFSDTFDYLVEHVQLEVDPPTPFQVGGDEQGERASVRAKVSEPVRLVDFYAPPRGRPPLDSDAS